MTINAEFETVDLIVRSSAETRGVDAFCLSLIKAERQLRKILTHLIFQFPCFTTADISGLRAALSNNKHIYFGEMEKCINTLFPSTVEQILGADYNHLRQRMEEAIEHRNKIFHGQLTQKYLTREELFSYVKDIRAWCEVLAKEFDSKIRYDGFYRNSFYKSDDERLYKSLKIQFSSIEDYIQFLKQHRRYTNK